MPLLRSLGIDDTLYYKHVAPDGAGKASSIPPKKLRSKGMGLKT
jgi:hypothetical protein